MIRPILACDNPYKTAEEFIAAGWTEDFSQPPESGDPLVGVSLYDNAFLLGVTDGYVADEKKNFIGCGIVFYLTIPNDRLKEVYEKHKDYKVTELEMQPWGDVAFEVVIGGFKFMITSNV